LIKGTIQQEGGSDCKQTCIIPNFIKQTFLGIKAQIDSNTIIVSDFNTLLSPIDRSSRPKNINKETSELNYTIDLQILSLKDPKNPSKKRN
jgi:hypothetical protein